jgi:G:T/U-mismatch repair DNA glycosylase
MVSKLSIFGSFPASYQVGWGYFFASPENAFGATWKVRGTITVLLPKKKK